MTSGGRVVGPRARGLENVPHCRHPPQFGLGTAAEKGRKSIPRL